MPLVEADARSEAATAPAEAPVDRATAAAHWKKTSTLMLTVLAVWLLAGFVVHLFAPSLNGIRVLGFPLGFYMAAQGSLVVFVVGLFWFARAQNRIDEEFGVQED